MSSFVIYFFYTLLQVFDVLFFSTHILTPDCQKIIKAGERRDGDPGPHTRACMTTPLHSDHATGSVCLYAALVLHGRGSIGGGGSWVLFTGL